MRIQLYLLTHYCLSAPNSPFSMCSVLMGWTLNFFTLNMLSFVSREHWRTIKEENGHLFLVPMYCYLLFLAPIHCPFAVHMYGALSPLATSSPNPSLVAILSWHHQFKHCTHQASAVNRAPAPSAHPPDSLDLPTSWRVVSSASSYAGTIPSNFVLADSFSTATTSLHLPVSWRAIERCIPHINTAYPSSSIALPVSQRPTFNSSCVPTHWSQLIC